MLEVQGLNIDNIPFRGLELVGQLLSFEEEPILIHYRDENKGDIIAYLVDFDETGYRWMLAKVTQQELFDYLFGIKSLKKLFSTILSDYIFLVDNDVNNNISSTKLLTSYSIPEKYFPSSDSFHFEGLNDFYSQYLKEYEYHHKLKEISYIIKIESKDKHHGRTIGSRDAAFTMLAATESAEAYISSKAFNLYSSKYGDVNRINRNVNKLKKRLSPRITQTFDHSFEVWMAIDILTFQAEDDTLQSELRSDLIDGYKKDVLDVDFTSEEDARIIAEKFKPDERKKIFEPLIRIFDNDNLIVTISDYKKTIVKKQKGGVTSSPEFKNIIFPKPTLEELEAELDRKTKLYSFVLALKEGDELQKIDKKQLLDSLVFTQEVAETPFEIPPPFEVSGQPINLKRRLRCMLKVDVNQQIQIYNPELDLFAEGNDIHEVTKAIKSQFSALLESFLKPNDTFDPIKKAELEKYV